ncbi:hypothetical protein FA15DRAFT_701141 [Coprinopsis marcescibilis]|uniref:F-box domain-containing protein n=1 Tax=Coprinopsis marcescibilis TaxID=230819 RepID=A0A5C3L6E7_COPMA|nr:hypothetical protein FA15DRAFT_701141 [Coprinopsis marcescibilis]
MASSRNEGDPQGQRSLNEPLTPSTRYDLYSLPTELLFAILELLDDESICKIGQTSQTFNHLSCSVFLFRNQMQDVLAEGRLNIQWTSSKATLTVLRNAFFLANLNEIHYDFVPGPQRLLRQTLDLDALVQRQRGVHRVEIDFSDIDSFCVGRAPEYVDRQCGEAWIPAFMDLMRHIAGHECKVVVVANGEELGRYLNEFAKLEEYVYDHDPQGGLEAYPIVRKGKKKKRSLRSLGSWIQARLHPRKPRTLQSAAESTTNTDTAIPQPRHLRDLEDQPEDDFKPRSSIPGLESITLGSSLMLYDGFYHFTADLLQASAQSLFELNIDCQSDLVPLSGWKSFFTSLELPRLSHISITSSFLLETPLIRPEFVTYFLARHPSLTVVRINGPLDPRLSSFFLPKAAILPKLAVAAAHPLYISWLMNLRNKLPNLKEVMLLSQDHQALSVPHHMMDDALRCVAEHMDVHHKSPHSPAIPLTLGIRFTTYGNLDAWFRSHLLRNTQTQCGASVLERLVSIKTVRISSFFLYRFEEDRFWLLLRFLSFFPQVEALELVDQMSHLDGEPDGGELKKKVKAVCPGIGRVVVNGDALRG